MDIIKVPSTKPLYLKYWYVIVGMFCLILFLVYTKKFHNVSYIVIGDELLLDTVVEGDLQVSVRGYGQLVSKDVYWIGAETDGRVEKILVRAGDQVETGDPLIQLDNLPLRQQLKDAELEFKAQKADVKATRIGLESQLLDLKADVANAEIEYQNAKMDLDANNELMNRGVNAISRLDHERAQLAVQKYKQGWMVQLQRTAKYEESLDAKTDSQQARLSISKNALEKIEYRVRSLLVRASVGGIVQEMELDMGQPIRQGDGITQIAKADELVAEIKIQELQVNDIRVGMKTEVDTRTNIIQGTVTRIDPRVVGGSVLVEIELRGVLPPEVRPDLNIEANIQVAHITNTQYVKRPVYARPSAQTSVYVLNESGDIAERRSVLYGLASTNYIEIVNGLSPGEKIIVSDSTDFEKHEKIYIN